MTAVNATVLIDEFDYVPDEDADTLVAAIDAYNSNITVQYADFETSYSLSPTNSAVPILFLSLDSTSSAVFGRISAAQDVGHLYDPQVSISQVVCTNASDTGPGPYVLNYPPPTRGDNLVPDVTTASWSYSTGGGGSGTITASGYRTRADNKTNEYYVTVADVVGEFEVTIKVNEITSTGSDDYTLQFRMDVPGDPNSSGAAVDTYYNDDIQLGTRQHDTLTAMKFDSGDTAVSTLIFQANNAADGDYAISDVGLWTTF